MKNISTIDLSNHFNGYQGSFVLYDTNQNAWNIFNIENAKERIAPNSTYKIYDALLGLESGIITPVRFFLLFNRMSPRNSILILWNLMDSIF